MRATATSIENNQVQLFIEVDDAEMKEAIDDAAKRLSREISVKGFRKGKVPRQVIEARLGGPDALRSEAIRASVPDFYAKAVSTALIDPIGQPELEITGGEDEGLLTLEAKVDVRPDVFLVGYRNLRVTIPSPVVSDDEIEAQIQRIRQTDAELREIERPLILGDIIVADIKASDPAGVHEDSELEDYSYELGSHSLADGLDEALVGCTIGQTAEAVGRRGLNEFIKYEVTIKQARERVLADLTDEWVQENTEYESVDAMRDGIVTQMRQMKLVEAQMARRDAMMFALSDLVDTEVAPDSLISIELEQRLGDLGYRLEQRGISFEYFLRLTGQSPEELMSALREDALRAVRVDLALRALAKAEELEPTDEEIDQEIAETAESLKTTPDVLVNDLFVKGRRAGFVAEVAKMKASKWLMENVSYVDPDGVDIDRDLLETDHSHDDSAYGETDE